MDSLQARVFALALPAIGLLVSGSAVDATATETNETVAVAPDGFTAIGTGLSIRSGSGVASTPTSLNFVQRMPAPDVDDSTKSEPLQSTSPAKVIKRDAANTITKLPPVEVETPVGDELPPMEATTALDSAPVAPEPKAIGETNAPRRLPSITNEVPSDRDSQKWVIDSTPPSVSHTTVSGALVSYDEPVIHIVRRESPPSMKREFYNDQFAALTEKAQQSKAEVAPAPPRTTERVADARATRLPLRQPGFGSSSYPVTTTKTGSRLQSVVNKSVAQPPAAKRPQVAAQPAKPATKPVIATAPKSQTAKVQQKVSASNDLQTRLAAIAPAAKAKVAALTATRSNGWSPVDIRSVNINQPVAEEPELHVNQATLSDKAQAQHAVQLGFELIQRRAHYSARARFIQALRIVSRSLDDQTFTTRHTSALRKALAAYEEAVDFYPTSAKPDEDVNLYMILGGHKTPVLAKADATRLTPRQCVREYMAYAEQEFTLALGNDGFASQALYGLGRLEASQETASTSAPQVRANRSLMLYQTAMLIDQRNYAAANELGVLLARYGKYDNAIAALQHCVKFSPEPTAWKNLANIYRRVGNHSQARMADARVHQTMARKPGTPFVANQTKVEWVRPESFVAMNANSNMQVTRATTAPQAQPAPLQANAPQIATPAKKTANRKLWPFGSKK